MMFFEDDYCEFTIVDYVNCFVIAILILAVTLIKKILGRDSNAKEKESGL